MARTNIIICWTLIYEMSVETSVDTGVEIILCLTCICGLLQRMKGLVLIGVAEASQDIQTRISVFFLIKLILIKNCLNPVLEAASNHLSSFSLV